MYKYYDVFMYLNIFGNIFLIVCLCLRRISKWQIAGKESPEEKKPRTIRQWVVDGLMVAAGILAMCMQLESIFTAMFTVPIAAIILFFVCLIRYNRAKRTQQQSPEEISAEEVRFRKRCLILFSVLLGVALAVGIGFMILFSMALAHM